MFEELIKTYVRIDQPGLMKRWLTIALKRGHAAVVKVMVKTAHRDLGRTRHDPSGPAFQRSLLATKGMTRNGILAHRVVSGRPKWKIN